MLPSCQQHYCSLRKTKDKTLTQTHIFLLQKAQLQSVSTITAAAVKMEVLIAHAEGYLKKTSHSELSLKLFPTSKLDQRSRAEWYIGQLVCSSWWPFFCQRKFPQVLKLFEMLRYLAWILKTQSHMLTWNRVTKLVLSRVLNISADSNTRFRTGCWDVKPSTFTVKR